MFLNRVQKEPSATFPNACRNRPCGSRGVCCLGRLGCRGGGLPPLFAWWVKAGYWMVKCVRLGFGARWASWAPQPGIIVNAPEISNLIS